MSGSVFASVVFLKVPEFARRSVTEQARLRAQLEAVIAVTAAELAPRERIILEAPDGAVVVVLLDPSAALRLAERALHASGVGLPLCVGINQGAVQVIGGGNGGEGLMGDGIAVAANAAAFAPSSQILSSRSFREALAAAAPGQEARLAAPATFTDAGLRSHEFFRLDPGGALRRRRRYAALSVALLVAVVGTAAGLRIAAEGQDVFLARMQGWAQKAKF